MKIITTPCENSSLSFKDYFKNLYAKANILIGRSFVSTTTANGIDVSFVVESNIDYIRSRQSYEIEKSTTDWIFNWVDKDDIVFDIGANVGAYTLLIAAKMKKDGGNGKVYAFEPSSLNFSMLNKNIFLNQVGRFALAYPLAVSESISIGEFFMSSFESGASSNNYGEAVSVGSKFTPAYVQGMISVDMDYFCNAIGKTPNHIKLDVDGIEYEILMGSLKILENPNLKTVLVEITDSVSNGRIEGALESAGFVCIEKEMWDCCDSGLHNLLFVRKELCKSNEI